MKNTIKNYKLDKVTHHENSAIIDWVVDILDQRVPRKMRRANRIFQGKLVVVFEEFQNI